MDSLFGDFGQLIQHNPWLAVLAVFFGGLTTASNPCVLAMIPLLMSVVAVSQTTSFRRSLGFSALFVLGLSVTFSILGLISALMGRMLGDIGAFWRYLVAGVCLIMGLHLLGFVKFSFNLPRPISVRRGGPIGAFLLGLLFGVVSTLCAIPILAVLLSYVASRGNIAYGGFLLLVYALGHAALILVAGTSMGVAEAVITSKKTEKIVLATPFPPAGDVYGPRESFSALKGRLDIGLGLRLP